VSNEATPKCAVLHCRLVQPNAEASRAASGAGDGAAEASASRGTDESERNLQCTAVVSPFQAQKGHNAHELSERGRSHTHSHTLEAELLQHGGQMLWRLLLLLCGPIMLVSLLEHLLEGWLIPHHYWPARLAASLLTCAWLGAVTLAYQHGLLRHFGLSPEGAAAGELPTCHSSCHAEDYLARPQKIHKGKRT
jgi:hypothetical protein